MLSTEAAGDAWRLAEDNRMLDVIEPEEVTDNSLHGAPVCNFSPLSLSFSLPLSRTQYDLVVFVKHSGVWVCLAMDSSALN